MALVLAAIVFGLMVLAAILFMDRIAAFFDDWFEEMRVGIGDIFGKTQGF